MLPDSYAALLAAGDVDAMRRLLSVADRAEGAEPAQPVEQERASASSSRSTPAADASNCVRNVVEASLHHEDEAGSDEAARSIREADMAKATANRPIIELPELGMRLFAQPVMGEAIWPAARALSRWLLDPERRQKYCLEANVIELGAGCAAPGLATLLSGASFAALTDANPDVIPLMQLNCELNGISKQKFDVGLLDWRDADDVARWAQCREFSLVLAADVLFGVGDIKPIATAVSKLLACHIPGASFILSRSAWFEDLQPTLVACLEGFGLALVWETFDQQAGATILQFVAHER